MTSQNIRVKIKTATGTYEEPDYKDFSLRIEKESPLFQTDYLPGEILFSSTFPDTARNAVLFGFANQIEICGDCVCLDYMIEIFESVWRKGTACISKADNLGYKIEFESNFDALVDIAQDSIRDFNEERVNVSTTPPTMVLEAQGSVGLMIIINGITILGNDFTDLVNNINAANITTGVSATGISPFLTLTGVAGEAFDIDYSVSFDFTSQTTGDWNIFMNDTVVNPNGKYVFIPVRNECAYDFREPKYDSENPDWRKYWINYYHNGSFVTNVWDTNSLFRVENYPICPYIHVMPVLQNILASINFSYNGLNAELNQLVFWNNYLLDDWDYRIVLYFNKYDSFFDIQNHIPDISVANLINGLRKTFGLVVDVSNKNKHIEFSPIADIVNGKYGTEDWTDFVQNLTVICEDDDGYQFEHATDSQDKIDAIYPYGRGDKKVKSELGRIYEGTWSDPINPTRFWKTPHIEQVCQTDHRDVSGQHPFGASVFWYRGMHPDSNGDNYPLGTITTKDYSNNQVGDTSLKWGDLDGLYKGWEDFVNKIGKKGIQGSFLLTPLSFQNFDYRKRIHINGNSFLIKDIKFDVDMYSECIVATAVLVKVC